MTSLSKPEHGVTEEESECELLSDGGLIFKDTTIANAFSVGIGNGLFMLGTVSWPAESGAGAFYLRSMVREALTRLALSSTESGDVESALAQLMPPPLRISALVDAFPIATIKGGENISPETIRRWHNELQGHIRAILRGSNTDLADWVRNLGEPWSLLGKVFFHLAENKGENSDKYPFAFLATYAHKSSSGGQISHLPLGAAMQMFSEDHNGLVSLLSPLERAAQSSPLIQKLLQTRELYTPMAWNAERAYYFLKDVPRLEEAGIIVRMVNLWKKEVPHVKLTVTSEVDEKQEKLSIHSLLRFSLAVTLGAYHLTPDEIRALLEQGEGLIRFHGEWVSVNPEKIKLLLDRWGQATNMMNRLGIPLVKGLRLLVNGPNTALPNLPPDDPDCDIVPGQMLQKMLEKLASETDMPTISPALDSILRPYQRDGVQFLYRTTEAGFGACLADDMGLGKTLQALTWLSVLENSTSSCPPLIIAPTSLLGNWADELARFCPEKRVLVFHPSMGTVPRQVPAHPEHLFSSYDVILTSYGMVVRLPWLQQLSFRALILDEAQAIKNASSQRSQAVRALSSPNRIALSGTPVENNLGELHSLMEFLNPGLLGDRKQFDTFTRALGSDYTPLRKLLRPFILRRLKTDRRLIPDLPDKTEVNAYCQLTPLQASLYQAEINSLHAVLDEEDPATRLTLMLPILAHLKQICNHPDQFLGTGDFDLEGSGKFLRLQTLARSIAQHREKLILFTQFRSVMGSLSDLLSTIYGRPGLQLHGATPMPQRQELVRLFQKDSGPPFMILSLKAAGTGLTLTQASHVIHFDRWWNPAVENQATDRAYRIGQHKNVLVHKLICQGTIEDSIDRMLRKKQAISDTLFGMGAGLENMLLHMTPAEIEELVRGPYSQP